MAVMKSKERASEPDQHECMRVYECVCAAKVDHLKMELILYSTKVSTFKRRSVCPSTAFLRPVAVWRRRCRTVSSQPMTIPTAAPHQVAAAAVIH